MDDSQEPRGKGQDGNYGEGDLIIPLGAGAFRFGFHLGDLLNNSVDGIVILLFRGATRDIPLA